MSYIDILTQLISFNTTTCIDTLDAVHWIKSYLEQYNIKPHLIFNPEGTRASIFATVGNPQKQGVLLAGHLDVVPADPAAWHTNPFELTTINDRVYGRGTSDMKGSIAVSLSRVPDIIQSGKTVHMLFTHDEEDTALGILQSLADQTVQKALKNILGCVVMEPTLNACVIGHKGAFFGDIHIHGRAAHSSNPTLAINALTHAVHVHKIFYDTAQPFKSEHDPLFLVPYPTADIAVFKSGTAPNVIPDTATLSYSARFFNAEQERRFIASLNTALEQYASSIEGLKIEHLPEPSLPGFSIATDHLFAAFIQRYAPLAAEAKVSFATEAGHISDAGIPTVVLGAGSIAQGHTTDEFIALSELKKFAQILDQIIANLPA